MFVYNTIFYSADPMKAGGPICYDDVVYIRLWDSGSSKILFVTCEIPHVDGFGLDNQRFLITFTEQPDRYCKFKILNCLEKGPNVRFLTKGNKITVYFLLCYIDKKLWFFK